MRELFVYYRVPGIHVAAARVVVQTFHAELSKRHTGLQLRLMRRDAEDRPKAGQAGRPPRGSESPDEAGSTQEAATQTWMETCAWPERPGGVTSSLQAEIELAAEPLLPLIEGPRHCEVFEPV